VIKICAAIATKYNRILFKKQGLRSVLTED